VRGRRDPRSPLPRVVITLPAYRAERTLAQTVADIPPGVADRLILVDDASPDNTAQLARELGIEVHVHRKNLGYGGNQKTCYAEALSSGADIVVLLHPDYQYEPKAVPLLIAPILAGDADMTFGSRFAGLGDPIGGGMPMYRYVGNRVTTIAENLMLGSRFTEMHSGLRDYTRRCLLSLPFLRYSNDFLFDSQLLIDAVTSGQRVVEVPIPTRYRKESSSIAIDRSLAYIVATLAHCARRAARRGRRGRRSPVLPLSGMRTSDGARPAAAGGCPACDGKSEAVPGGGLGSLPAGSNLFRCTSCGLLGVGPPARGEREPSRAQARLADDRSWWRRPVGRAGASAALDRRARPGSRRKRDGLARRLGFAARLRRRSGARAVGAPSRRAARGRDSNRRDAGDATRAREHALRADAAIGPSTLESGGLSADRVAHDRLERAVRPPARAEGFHGWCDRSRAGVGDSRAIGRIAVIRLGFAMTDAGNAARDDAGQCGAR
jgi:hypothetical protein